MDLIAISKKIKETDEKLEHIMKQQATILDMMTKFIDHVEDIEAIAIQKNRMKN
jgi:hypothetical protein